MRSRKDKAQELPRVELLKPQAAVVALSPEMGEVAAVGSYVLKDMNRDLFVELTSYLV